MKIYYTVFTVCGDFPGQYSNFYKTINNIY